VLPAVNTTVGGLRFTISRRDDAHANLLLRSCAAIVHVGRRDLRTSAEKLHFLTASSGRADDRQAR
jgi:hypothetical protein